MDYQYIYGNDHCHSTAGTQQNAFPSGTSFWFPVKGFVVVITDFLRTATAVLTTGEMRREKVVERKLVWKNAWIYNMCLPTRGKVCKPSPDWFRRRHLVRLNMLVCDWGIACQEYLFVLALSCVCVCLCRGARRGSSVEWKPNPLRTLSHVTPAIINHNSNWPPLTPNGP